MYKKVLIFAGTIEGRTLAQSLAAAGTKVHACVATEYGESLIEKSESMTISHNRMSQDEMEELMHDIQPELVVDATHPYAVEVTKNIQAAAKGAEVRYVRLLRSTQKAMVTDYTDGAVCESVGDAACQQAGVSAHQKQNQVVYVDSVTDAVEFLADKTGNIFVTTGSKELEKFTKLENYQQRVFARVLSIPSVVENCARLGFQGNHLICMQGPFSREINEAMLRHTEAAYLVTKESGAAGGFLEKCQAAADCGVNLIVIGRPVEEAGLSLEECYTLCGLEMNREVTLVGIGMGHSESMTGEAREAIHQADLLIGAQRMVDASVVPGQKILHEYKPDVIANYVDTHTEYKKIVVVLSGDTGFFSGAKKLLLQLKQPYRLIPGISSMSYFCSRIGKTWDDVVPVTMHGRTNNLVGEVQNAPKIFALVGTEKGVQEQCRKLTRYGLGDCRVWIGENLSYESEHIFSGLAKEFTETETEKLCVLYIENDAARQNIVTHGMADEAFLRDKVPMTKEEIRSITISKLRLQRDSVIYDIGAGTGSVSVEMARIAFRGNVYAIEKKAEAVELLKRNQVAFAVDNMEIVEGLAPEALENLPVPTHAFIGGSSGNMRQIIECLLQKNPQVRIVINVIALESVAECMECLKKFEFADVDIACVNVSKAKQLGNYHMMMGQNPVYVISCQK